MNTVEGMLETVRQYKLNKIALGMITKHHIPVIVPDESKAYLTLSLYFTSIRLKETAPRDVETTLLFEYWRTSVSRVYQRRELRNIHPFINWVTAQNLMGYER
jgi:hypothetical protein